MSAFRSNMYHMSKCHEHKVEFVTRWAGSYTISYCPKCAKHSAHGRQYPRNIDTTKWS